MKIDGRSLTIDDVVRVAKEKVKVSLSPAAEKRMLESYEYLQSRIEAGDTMYGVNTGFGALASVKISNKEINQLSLNIVRSHAVGSGTPLSREETRAVLLLRANALARGNSGIRIEAVKVILNFLNKDILPVIPGQGSVGASGDLAPLSHVALSLIGEGKCWDKDKIVSTRTLLRKKKVKPLKLEGREGLALINGCQVMTAIGLLNLDNARNLLRQMDFAAAMTLEALQGSRSPFHPSVAKNRAHSGDIQTASNMRKILGITSEIAKSHENCDKVQDAYSLRCVPAVHGSARDAVNFAIQKLETEANSSTDNPLVFPKENKVISCGNFHGQPIALAMDMVAVAMTSLMSISERRVEKMVNPAMSSGLPAFVSKNPGLNSGLMIVHVAAAALVSESKVLSHPASADSIPTNADKEDHVSMGTIAARKLTQVLKNCERSLAIELFTAQQALFFLRPLKPAPAIAKLHRYMTKQHPWAKEDRFFGDDLDRLTKDIQKGNVLEKINSSVKGLY